MNRYLDGLRCPGGAVRAALGTLAGTLVLAASCNDPNVPSDGTPAADLEYSGGYDSGGGSLVFQLRAPGGAPAGVQLVATDVTWDAASQELHAQVAIRNDGESELPGPVHVEVGSFDPNGIQPLSGQPLPCPACPACPCRWPWMFDYAGTFGDDGVLSPGETSAPFEWILHVPGGASFSFEARLQRAPAGPRAGVISGSVFTDTNGNGRRENNEPGIAGAVLSLQHGDMGASAITDSAGGFEFEVVEAGLYEIRYESAGDCSPTTPLTRQVFIVGRPDGTLSGYDHADFGCGGRAPADSVLVQVIGVVFEDVNRNGSQDPGEPGIAGVRIDGATPQCPTFAPITARTDDKGRYSMLLPPCAPPYIVQHAPLDGYIDTTPNPVVFPGRGDPNGGPGTELPPPTVFWFANFGVARADANEAAVEGVVYVDSNRNGTRDPEEPGLAGIQVSASGLECMTPVAGITRTDPRGHYILYQSQIHCPEPWSVAHGPVAGHCDTSPNPVRVPNALPTSLPVRHRADFGVAPCDSVPPPQGFAIEGFVWFDADRDGIRDPDEPGLGGVVLQIESPCEALWPAATTDANGHYVFRPIPCPVTAVVQTRPVFAIHTTPNPHPVDPGDIPPNGVLRLDFGVYTMRR